LLRAELRHDLGSPGNVARVEDANSVTPFSAMAASRSAEADRTQAATPAKARLVDQNPTDGRGPSP